MHLVRSHAYAPQDCEVLGHMRRTPVPPHSMPPHTQDCEPLGLMTRTGDRFPFCGVDQVSGWVAVAGATPALAATQLNLAQWPETHKP